jgi:hypothetical protein
MMLEATRSPHVLTTTCNVHEPVDPNTNDLAYDHIDAPVTTWENHWIDIGGEG